MSDFWVATLSEVIAGLLSGVVLALIPLVVTRKKAGTIAGAGGRNSASAAENGNQIHVGGDVLGDVTINDQRVSITQNISASLAAQASGGGVSSNSASSNGRLAAACCAFVALACLFVFYHPIALGLMVGAVVGLLVNFVVVVIRTSHAALWSGRTRQSCARVAAAVGVAVTSWVAIYTTTIHGYNLLAMQVILGRTSVDLAVTNSAITNVVEAVLGPIRQVIEQFGAEGLMFLVCLLAGALFSAVVVFRAWQLVFDWASFVRFASGNAPLSVTARAKKFRRENLMWLAELALAGTIAIVFASGLAFSGYYAMTGQFELPSAVSTPAP
ncbi:hypothetical protein [Subtercola lobariae]|uniref:Uncharacterized protein n=1 Tax=Subtercola lobariae TaxID=1588641 RepID=A0A917B201_9MICO|nr:hypothetical protein [Subtercola lobariae]GGF17384.1 hypothetical protein GCM10011399_08910 [Subtercola lobariae]